MKVCPKCNSTDVPDDANQCPFCGYYFERPVKPERPIKPKPSESGKKGTEEEASVGSKGGQNGSSGMQGIGKFILLVIVTVILVIIIKACGSSQEVKPVPEVETEPIATPEPTPTPEVVEEEIPYEDEYILPYSNSEYLTQEDLDGLSKEELRIARNEIYARHGRRFNDSGLQSYFDSKSWYEGTIAPEDFTESHTAAVFNQYELANKDFISQNESTH